MSSYQCNSSIHETIATWNDKSKGNGGLHGHEIRHNAQMLWAANARAVVARYGDSIGASMVGATPVFSIADLSGVNPLQILKACNELRYQLMETDDYATTQAWLFIDSVREQAIYMLIESMELIEAMETNKAMSTSH